MQATRRNNGILAIVLSMQLVFAAGLGVLYAALFNDWLAAMVAGIFLVLCVGIVLYAWRRFLPLASPPDPPEQRYDLTGLPDSPPPGAFGIIRPRRPPAVEPTQPDPRDHDWGEYLEPGGPSMHDLGPWREEPRDHRPHPGRYGYE